MRGYSPILFTEYYNFYILSIGFHTNTTSEANFFKKALDKEALACYNFKVYLLN